MIHICIPGPDFGLDRRSAGPLVGRRHLPRDVRVRFGRLHVHLLSGAPHRVQLGRARHGLAWARRCGHLVLRSLRTKRARSHPAVVARTEHDLGLLPGPVQARLRRCRRRDVPPLVETDDVAHAHPRRHGRGDVAPRVAHPAARHLRRLASPQRGRLLARPP